MTANSARERHRVGLVGARGHVGSEIIRLIAGHPALELSFVSSRSLAGASLSEHIAGGPAVSGDLVFEDLSAEQVAEREAEVYILALPNGLGADYVAALDRAPGSAVIVDVSADHRFHADWVYGQPERCRARVRAARRIANPGCYATGAQLAIWPVVDRLSGPPSVFGVSGYSGAGTTPSPRNDPEVLRDNLLPYSLAGHLHQREVSHQLGRPVHFTPHVAPFFRGITVTVSMTLTAPVEAGELAAVYRERYAGEPLVRVVADDVPLVRDIAGRHHVAIGGLTVDPGDPRHVVVVATLDNLLKGAATQVIQNINLSLGLGELDGIPAEPPDEDRNLVMGPPEQIS